MSNEQVYISVITMDGGQRTTAPNQFLEFCILADHHPDIAKPVVEVDWYAGSNLVFSDTITRPKLHRPRFGSGGGNMPGSVPGATLDADSYYVARRLASDFPSGVVSVVCRVRSGSFVYQWPKPARAYNHPDGASPPSTAVRYVDTATGSDVTGDGLSYATAFAGVGKAIESAQAGTSFAQRDVSNLTINVRGKLTGWNYGMWHTSAPGWINIVADSGATLERVDPLQYVPADAMRFGDSSVGGEARVRLVGFNLRDTTPVIFRASGVPAHIWLDGCGMSSRYYNPANPFSVRWADASGPFFDFDGADAPVSRYVSNLKAEGVVNGAERYELLVGAVVKKCIGIAAYTLSPVTSSTTNNLYVEGMRYAPGEVRGYVRLPPLDSDPGVTLRARTVSPGVVRVQAPVGADVLVDFQELSPLGVGNNSNPFYGIRLENFSDPDLNTVHRVLASGVESNRHYIDIAITDAITEQEITNGRMYTAQVRAGGNFGNPYWYLHPDVLYERGPRTRDFVSGVCAVDVRNAQVLFSGGGGQSEIRNSNFHRNIRGPGRNDLVNNFQGTHHRNCVFKNFSDSSQMQFSPDYLHTGSVVVSSIMGSIGSATTIAASGLRFEHCHLLLGPAVGTTTTVGAAWESDPSQSPWLMQPTPAMTGTGHPAYEDPLEWSFLAGKASKGAWRNTSLVNWSTDVGAGVRCGNYSASDEFDGWMPFNTDLPTDPGITGKSHGFYIHRAGRTGEDTYLVDILVKLAPGQGIKINSLELESSEYPAIPEVPAGFFGGDPQFNGVNMVLISDEQDGRAIQRMYSFRPAANNRCLGLMFTRHYPGEPWVRAEIAIGHANPTTPELTVEWPGGSITWGNSTIAIMGLPVGDGSPMQAGTTVIDGQFRGMQAVFSWANRYRQDANDAASVAALRSFRVVGHGIQRLYPDGNPYRKPLSDTFWATYESTAIANLHNWEESPESVVKVIGQSGNQGDQVWNRSEAMYEIRNLTATYAEGLRTLAKPVFFHEVDGRPIDILNRIPGPVATGQGLLIYSGRPWFGSNSTDRLGKTQELSGVSGIPGSGVGGPNNWMSHGDEHWWISSLYAGARYFGSRMYAHFMECQAALWLGRWFSHPSYGAFWRFSSNRSNLMQMKTAVELWYVLRDRTKAEEIRTRCRQRMLQSSGAFDELWPPPYGPAMWDVRTVPTSSIPHVPGFSGFINAPAIFFFDYAMRILGDMEGKRPEVEAAKNLLFDRGWQLVQGVGPGYYFYEHQHVSGVTTPPWSTGLNYSTTWAVPLAYYTLRSLPPTDARAVKAKEILDQVSAQALLADTDTRKRKWFPPSPSNLTTEVLSGGVPGTVITGSPSGGPVMLSGFMSQLSTTSGQINLLSRPYGISSQASQTLGNLTVTSALRVSLSAQSNSQSTTSGRLTVFRPQPSVINLISQKQRIHNGISAFVKSGRFFQALIDSTTGQMSVNTSKPLRPFVAVKEIEATYKRPTRYTRDFVSSELSSWTWHAVVEFSGQEASCDFFIEDTLATAIKIPPAPGVPNDRTLLVHLVGVSYAHPAEQSPQRGTRATFEFEIDTNLLRK